MSVADVTLPPIPYGPFDPHTADLQQLRAELELVYREHPGSGRALDAFNRLHQAAAYQGRPLNGLRRHSRDEAERFFAQTVEGPDGHVYWTGRESFERNDGAWRTPKRWWWEREHGPIGTTTLRVIPLCGDGACINPDHHELRHFNSRKYSQQQLIGALQVEALRLGHTPGSKEWEANRGKPSSSLFVDRFGSWANACRQAGLAYDYAPPLSDGQLVAAIKLARKTLGRWPNSTEFDIHPAIREAFAREGITANSRTVWRRLGSWKKGLRKAGKR